MPPTRRQMLALGAAAATSAACSGPGSRSSSSAPATTPTTPNPTAPAARSGHPRPQATTTSRARTSATEIGSGPRTSSAVALTFHGAGDLATARAVLGELRRGGARGTVLAVGTWLAQEPAGARLVLDGGSELGNHTEHHLPMRSLSAATAYAEIEQCAQRLRRLTGDQGRWFRASGTQHTTPTIRRAAARAGYTTCLSYDVDSLDWTDPTPATVVDAVLRDVRGGSIVSLHLGHRVTVRALPAILDGLQRKGLHPVPMAKLVA